MATKPVHPDTLDVVATAGDASRKSAAVELASVPDVIEVLTRITSSGGLRRIPKKALQRDIVLAVLCLNMQRYVAYTELELNDLLKTKLSLITADVDHATCRRYLVDLGFVKRDRAGARYFLSYPRFSATLSAQAATAAARFLDGLT